MSTMQRVREAISQSHDAIEQTDFAKSLLDGRITRPAYGVYLNQIWHIHQALEQSLAACDRVAAYCTPAMIRTAVIARDAAAMGQRIDANHKLPTTRDIESHLKTWATESPFSLLGCLYILEGSRMGSLMIAKPLAKALGLSELTADRSIVGVEYHLEGAAETPRRVRQFKTDIDAANLNAADERALTSGACTFIEMLKRLYDALPVADTAHSGVRGVCPFSHHASSPSAHLRSA